MAGSTTGHADDEVHRMCFRRVSSERDGHMYSHAQLLNWPRLAHTQSKALQDSRNRRSLPTSRDCRRGGRDRRRSWTVPKSFFSSFRKKQEGSGKVKEKVAQDDVANSAVGGTGIPVGQANAVLEEVGSSTGGNTTQIVFERQADISPEALAELIQQVGWPKRKLSKLETALKGSYLVSAVLKRELSADRGIVSEQLIALIRCTSDRVFNATIWDVLVSPEYQGRGIGRFMVARTVEFLKEEQIGNICLFADADAVGFYQQLGFKPDPDGVRGMFWNQ